MERISVDNENTWFNESQFLATFSDLAAKQDTISDLSDIRSGASAGATAVQPDDLPTFGSIVTHDADEFLPSSTDYIKDASVSQDGNALTLKKNDNTQVTFAPSGGGGVIDEKTARIIAGSSSMIVYEGTDGLLKTKSGSIGYATFMRDQSIKKLYAGNAGASTSLQFAFYQSESIEEIYPIFAVNNVSTFNSLFSGCTSLSKIDLSLWDTSSATNFSNMFTETAFAELDVRHFHTSSVTKMNGMFGQMPNLVTIGLPAIPAGCDAEGMCAYCNHLVNVIMTDGDLISSNVKFNYSPISRESAIVLFTHLDQDNPGTITLSVSTKNQLTDSDIQIATDKNWVIA